jgi:hypothetical protein
MRRLIAASLAALPFALSAQGTQPAPEKAPVAVGGEKAAGVAQGGAAPASPLPAYRSPFADYRPFSAEVVPKDWRRANDEVREVGGHLGLMKGEPAQLQGHGAHGAKQPVPPERR